MILARTLACGFFAGALLSAARLPLGHDLLALPAVAASSAYGMRALGLVVLGIAFVGARPLFAKDRRPALGLLFGASLGFAACARWRLQFESGQPALVLLRLASFAGAITLLARWRDSTSSAVSNSKIDAMASRGSNTLQAVGLLALGGGLAVALEALARHARLLTTQTELDDDLLVLVLFISSALGALAFGPLLRSSKARRLGLPLFGALAALLCLLSLRTVALLASQRGWDQFVRSYGMLAGHRGHFRYGFMLGAVLFAIPSFALGAALWGANRLHFAALLLGSSLGLLSVPALLGQSQVYPDPSGTSSAALVPLAALVASCGSLLFCVSLRRKLGSQLLLALPALLVLVSLGFYSLRKQDPILIFAPWSTRPVSPSLVLDVPEGLLTIEPTERGIDRVTLDRRILAPGIEGAQADNDRLQLTFEILPELANKDEPLNVLLVGQLTPGRALGLLQRSVSVVDRTAAWHAAMPRLEQELFQSAPPPGEILTPHEARRRILEGRYDLIWIPPVDGEAPCIRMDSLGRLPENTTLVAWVPVQGLLAQRNLPAGGVLFPETLTQFSVAFVRGAEAERTASVPTCYYEPQCALAMGMDRPSLSVIRWLKLQNYERGPQSLLAFSERIREANHGGAFELLTRALAHFHSIQVESSPWASAAEAIELDETSLELFSAAARAGPLDELTKRLIEQVSEVLIGKRRIDLITRYIAPLAEGYRGWTELELVLAHAELEGLQFEKALARLQDPRLPEAERQVLRARALVGLGRGGEAIESLGAQLGQSSGAERSLRSALVDTLIEIHGPQALEFLGELDEDWAREAWLREAVRERIEGHDAHEH